MSSLPFKPNLDEKLDLNSASFRSTKTGRFTRKFPLEKFIASLNKLTDTSEKIKLVSSELVDSSQLVVADLDKFLLSKKREQATKTTAVRVDGPKASNISKPELKKAGFDILKFTALFALLFNDKIRAIVTGFFDGIIENLGLPEPVLKTLKFITKNLFDILKVYFGFKILKGVYDAFMSIKRLAEVTGILSQANQNKPVTPETDLKKSAVPEIDGEKEDLKKQKEKLKNRNDKLKRRLEKKNIKYNKKIELTRVLKKNINVIKNKVNLFKDYSTKTFNKVKELTNFKTLAIKFKQMVFGGLKSVLKVVRAIKTGLAITGIGYLLGAAVDAGINTLVDYFTTDPEKGESGVERVGKLFADNFIKSVTLGFFDLNTVKRVLIKGIDFLLEKKIISSWLANKAKDIIGKPKEEKEDNAAEGVSKPPVSASQPPASKKAVSEQPETNTRQQTSAASTQASAPTTSATNKTSEQTAEPSSTAPAVMEPVASTGQQTQINSEQVVIAKKQNNRQSPPIIVNNTTNKTVMPAETPRNFSTPSVFSDSVGF